MDILRLNTTKQAKEIQNINKKIDLYNLEISRLNIEKNIRELLYEMDDQSILNIIKDDYPDQYNEFEMTLNVFNNFNITDLNYNDLEDMNRKIFYGYKLYLDIYYVIKEFYNIYTRIITNELIMSFNKKTNYNS